MEKSSFFNAVITGVDQDGIPIYDRTYKAESFAEYFASFIGNGVFPNPATCLQIIAIDNNMKIRIRGGKAWVNGYIYINTDDFVHTVSVADSILNRIDRVVLKLDFLNREIRSYIKKGTGATNPIAPALQRDADAYEICLAEVRVNKGVIKITQADITDTRLNNSLCGIVHGTVQQVDTTEIFRQFQAWYEQKKDEYNTDFATWTSNKKSEFTKWTSDKQTEYTNWVNNKVAEFNTWFTNNTQAFIRQWNTWFGKTVTWENDWNTWFNSIKEQLAGNVATNLLNLINQNTDKINSLTNDMGAATLNTTNKKVKEAINEVNATVNGINTEKINVIPTKVATDFPNTYPIGISTFYTTNTTWKTSTGWNGADAFLCQVDTSFSKYNYGIVQTIIIFNSSHKTLAIYKRSSYSHNVWGSWEQIATRSDVGDKTSLLTNDKTNLVGAINEVNTKASNIKSKRTCRFVIGTSTARWTENDCDYLCDGTADDVEFNRAIADLPTSGGEIVILDGTYNIGAEIILNKDNISIVGNGSVTTLKRMFDGTGENGVINIKANYCNLSNLAVDGNKVNFIYQKNNGIIVWINTHDNTVSNTYCSNCKQSGIGIHFYQGEHSYNNIFLNNRCFYNYIGIELSSNKSTHSRNTAIGNVCNNSVAFGIVAHGKGDNVMGNTCNYNGTSGIQAGYYTSITGNTCIGNTYGISADSRSHNLIVGNLCNNNSKTGISISGGVQYIGNTVTGNTCVDNGINGIFVNSSNNNITGNTCHRGTGLTTDYTATQYTIFVEGEKNLVADNMIMGKNYSNGGSNNTLVNNKYY